MSSKKASIEERLRRSPSMHVLAETLRECLTSGTLGKHMPRYYVPQKCLSDAPSGLVNVITLEGIKDGRALFEIRPHPNARRESPGPEDFARLRSAKQAPFTDKPWLRALVPLKGTVAGTIIQLRQPPNFRAAYVGFIYNDRWERRGSFSRHTETHDVSNGAVDSSVPSVQVTIADRRTTVVAVPVDSFVRLQLRPTYDGVLGPWATAGVLVPTASLSARRVERKQMRDAATEYMSRISAALSIMDMSGNDNVKTANDLQDILGLSTFMPDYHFRSELEVASGRWQHTHIQLYESEFSAAVLAGALHAGARTEFFSDNDARIFNTAVRSFTSILRNKQDKVFQANTIFSSTPAPDKPDDFALLHTVANGDIKTI